MVAKRHVLGSSAIPASLDYLKSSTPGITCDIPQGTFGKILRKPELLRVGSTQILSACLLPRLCVRRFPSRTCAVPARPDFAETMAAGVASWRPPPARYAH